MYAKIFKSKRFNQIVVMRRQDKDGGPEVRIYFQPEGMGVCEFGIGFRDNEPGDAPERLDKAFKSLDGSEATILIESYLDQMQRRNH